MNEEELQNYISEVLKGNEDYYKYISDFADKYGFDPATMEEPLSQSIGYVEEAQRLCKDHILALRSEGSAQSSSMPQFMALGDKLAALLRNLQSVRNRQKSIIQESQGGSLREDVKKLFDDLFAIKWFPDYVGVPSLEALRKYKIKHPFLKKGAHTKNVSTYMLDPAEFDKLIEALAEFYFSESRGFDEKMIKALEAAAENIRKSVITGEDILMAKAAFNKYEGVYNSIIGS